MSDEMSKGGLKISQSAQHHLRIAFTDSPVSAMELVWIRAEHHPGCLDVVELDLTKIDHSLE